MFCSALPAAHLASTTSQVSVFKNISEKIADILFVPIVFMHFITQGQSYEIINTIIPYLYGGLVIFLIYAGTRIYKDNTLVNKRKKIIKLLVWAIILGLFFTYLWVGSNLLPGFFTLC